MMTVSQARVRVWCYSQKTLFLLSLSLSNTVVFTFTLIHSIIIPFSSVRNFSLWKVPGIHTLINPSFVFLLFSFNQFKTHPSLFLIIFFLYFKESYCFYCKTVKTKMDAIRKQASRLREQVAKQQQVVIILYGLFLNFALVLFRFKLLL